MISNDNNDGAARAASIEGERQQVLRLLDWLEEGAGLAIVAITVFKARPQPQPFGSTERLAAFMEANIDKMLAVTPEVKVPIERMPADLKEQFRTAFEVEPRWLVEAASRRQKWIDQAQSLNLYIAEANGKKLDVTYKMAWLLGLKTTYYLRAIGATQTEKSTINDGKLNRVSAAPQAPAEFNQAADVPQACSIDDPDCEACQ